MLGHKLLLIIDLDYSGSSPPPEGLFPCTRDMIVQGLAHQRIYAIIRSVRTTVGPWGIVLINGKDRIAETSVPVHVKRIPRDAVEIPDELAEKILHNTDGDHSFVGRYAEEVIDLIRARYPRKVGISS